MERHPDYDVIIVGGRPAGSTLAARLGRYGLRVLLLERTEFPSLPAASSPFIYPSTMKLLDEIGADEAAYARGTPPIHEMSFHSRVAQVYYPIPEDNGRDYGYGIDRARFDAALWDTAMQFPNVEGRQCFNVTDVLFDGDRVTGVTGKASDGKQHTFSAQVVVGADGRFSKVARALNAEIRDACTDYPTSLLYAYWRDVKPYGKDGAAASIAYEGMRHGLGYLVMDSADNTTAVAVEGRADVVKPSKGQAESFYLDVLRELPDLWERLQDAEMVTGLRGMRRIGNYYRQAGGPGWALVGDAYHQKDPLDGQGIYNATFTAKALAWAIRYWWQGAFTWDEALEWYDETARIKTYGMYKNLLSLVRTSFYEQPPEWLQEMMSRWIADDPMMSRLYGQFISRKMPADVMTLMRTPVAAMAMVRGGLRDLRGRMRDRVRESLPF